MQSTGKFAKEIKNQDANLARSFFSIARVVGDKPLFFQKVEGNWQSLSWREVNNEVLRLASVLLAAGIVPGSRVIISAENRPEWAICDLAIIAIGAIVVPAYTTNTVDDHHFIMEHSGAIAAITSG